MMRPGSILVPEALASVLLGRSGALRLTIQGHTTSTIADQFKKECSENSPFWPDRSLRLGRSGPGVQIAPPRLNLSLIPIELFRSALRCLLRHPLEFRQTAVERTTSSAPPL